MNFRVIDRLINTNKLIELTGDLSDSEFKIIAAESQIPEFTCPNCGRVFNLSADSKVEIVLGVEDDKEKESFQKSII